MATKLKRTLVGVGIALGGSVPACFGRSEATDVEPLQDDVVEPSPGSGGSGGLDAPRGGAPASGGSSAGTTGTASTAGTGGSPSADAGPSDPAKVDSGAAGAADGGLLDPFCDVTWPPTKGTPYPKPITCVDPLRQCTDAVLPYCYRRIGEEKCEQGNGQIGPLYCVEGAWQCPPGTAVWDECGCWGAVGASKTCDDPGGEGGAAGAGGAAGERAESA